MPLSLIVNTLPILLNSEVRKSNLNEFYLLKIKKNVKRIKNVKNAFFIFFYKNVCKRLLHLCFPLFGDAVLWVQLWTVTQGKCPEESENGFSNTEPEFL